MKQRREEWISKQPHLPLQQLVFIDESATNRRMTRLRGRAKGGKRCMDKAPYNRGSTTSILGSLRLDGSNESLVIQGAVDGVVFRTYVREILLPTLRPGDRVISDNVSIHKDREARELIESVGAHLEFLPPYSPELNPIEMMWSKVKSYLRGIKARTQEDLEQGIGKALSLVSPNDAKGWFSACGYVTYH